MAERPPRLTVLLSPQAVNELDEIWQWNAERYSPSHADAYLAFLKSRIYALVHHPLRGRTLSLRPDLRYVLLRRSSGGHGHVVVYRVDETAVQILHIFHTSEDWPRKLES